MVQLVDEHLGFDLLLLVPREIDERGEILDDFSILVADRANKDDGPEIAAILAAILDFRAALGMRLKLALYLRERGGICAALHQEIEVLAEYLFPFVSGQGEKGVIGEDDRMAGFLRVREYHGHPCLIGGDDERAEFVPKALDIGFGGLLPFGLVDYFFRHTGM